MFSRPLKSRILLSMFIIIAVLAALIAILGYYVIKADIMDRAQRKGQGQPQGGEKLLPG